MRSAASVWYRPEVNWRRYRQRQETDDSGRQQNRNGTAWWGAMAGPATTPLNSCSATGWMVRWAASTVNIYVVVIDPVSSNSTWKLRSLEPDD